MNQTAKKSLLCTAAACMFTLAMLLCTLSTTAFAANDASKQTERRTVRVAFPSQGGMSGVGGSGDLIGYNYEYLQELAEYAGWDMEYITFDDMSANDGIMSAMQMVMTGEADLLGPMLKSDEVEKLFDFPQDNYGVVYTTLCALEKSSLTSVNYTKISPLRVAVYATASVRNKEVEAYLKQLGVEYTLIACDTTDEQLKLLQDGKADVLSSITLSYFDGTRSVAEFAPRPYYFVTTKGNQELVKELEHATQSLNYTQPYLQEQLQEEFFGDTSSGYVLTDEEEKRMDALETLDVLCVDHDAPYVLRGKNGEPQGMMVCLLDEFAKTNNISLSYTFCDSPMDIETEWQTGKYDCIIGIPLSSKYCASTGVVRTEAVTTVDLVLYAKQRTTTPLSKSTVAIYSRLMDQVNTDSFGTVLPFDDPMECYKAVESGKADYGCTDRLIAEYALFERNSSLVTIPLVGYQEKICLAVSRDMGDEFVSALNKYIHTLPDSTKTTYLSEGSRHDSANGLVFFVRTHPIGASLVIAGIVILVISSVMIAFSARRNKQQNRELQKANSAKSDFLSRMSHDIRTPMNAIIGYLSIAKDTEHCPEKVVHCIDNSEIAAKHLLQLINDVLDMSSIESGRMKIASEEFNLTREIADASAIFYQTAKAKGVRFEVQVENLTQEWVVGDSLRLNQIVMNLLSNAVKFTPENGLVRLQVQQMEADESGVDFKLTVSDTGIGMSEEYMSRLFQPFEQESAATARQYGGSGLGLSIVHNLVSMMDGTIAVESKQAVGTTFTVTLRFACATKHKNTVQRVAAGSKIYILLVSAQEQKSEAVRTMLQNCGVRVDVVADERYAVKRIRRRKTSDYPYKICLLDWNGLENGTETAAAIKAEDSTLVLAAAGYDITAFEEQAHAAGVDRILPKPLFQSMLARLVHGVLDHTDASETTAVPVAAINFVGKRAILAEDNAMNMEIATMVLNKAGIQVDGAENGWQAVKLFVEAPAGTYDFILMDVQMPVLDGYEATKEIRASQHPEATTIPIIAMTANAFAEDVATAHNNGMNAHIAKPVNYDKLFVVLHELAKREQTDKPVV